VWHFPVEEDRPRIGLAKTIMLVEIADSDIPWTAPRDLPIEAIGPTINADRRGISNNHRNGVNVLFCGGSSVSNGAGRERECGLVEFLNNSMPADQLKAMLTIHGGER
jgi:prepilin-type processing-associated H-X9-DG protein